MIVFLMLLTIIYLYGRFEYYNLKTRRINLKNFQKNHSIPKTAQGKKIIYISDLQFDHLFTGFDHLGMHLLMKRLIKEEPDLLLLGGDLIHHKNEFNILVFHILDQIKCRKIMVMGNHDYRDLKTVEGMIDQFGIELLKNSWTDFYGMNIIGVDDYKKGHARMPKVNRKGYGLLLSHNPDFLDSLRTSAVDLALSGHFHGGQITFFGLFAPAIVSEHGQKYRYGFVNHEDFDIYVSSGVGGKVGIFPLRFFARPEIVVLNT